MDLQRPGPPFALLVRTSGERQVIELAGELDIATAPELTARVGQELLDGKLNIVIDLRSVSFIDSTGLRALVLAEKSAVEAGGTLALVQGSEQVQRVFALVQLDRYFTFLDPGDIA